MVKFAISYLVICVMTHLWLFLDTLYYSNKKPSQTVAEIREKIADVDKEINDSDKSDFEKLDVLLDIKEYWERELAKLIN